jgi:hypothetical protein
MVARKILSRNYPGFLDCVAQLLQWNLHIIHESTPLTTPPRNKTEPKISFLADSYRHSCSGFSKIL